MRARLLGWFVVVLMVLSASSGAAQQRFAAELVGGAEVPLSSASRSDAVIPSGPLDDPNVPVLVDYRHGAGARFGLRVLAGALEFGYSLERLSWSHAVIVCRGDREATVQTDGEIDDAEVRYDCSGERERRDDLAPSANAAVLHTLSAGVRLYARPRSAREDDAVEGGAPRRDGPALYAVVAPGLTLTRSASDGTPGRVRAGATLMAGGGIDVALDRSLSLTFDLRYAMTGLARSGSTSATASRAVERGGTAVGTVLDVFHRLGATVGLRVDFR